MQDFAKAPCPWQIQQWNHLLQSYRNRHLPHALLLTGARGLGQETFARAFAQFILCERRDSMDVACGQCKPCLLIKADTHPDIYILQPEEAGKQIRIDAVRAMVQAAQQTAQQNHYKIIIINPADQLNVAASNALLKNLEEPAANTLFLLIGHELSLIAATIRSRCQLLAFKAPDRNMARAWLQPLLKQGENLDLILSLAENAPLQALALAHEERLADRENLFGDLRQIAASRAQPLQIAAKWLKFDANELLTAFINVVTDCIRLQMGLPSESLLNQDKLEFIRQIAAKFSPLKGFAYLDKLHELKRQLQQTAQLNQQLLIETLFCQWCDYAR